MQINFLPSTDGAIAAWLRHFANRLPLYAAELQLSPQVISSVEADARCLTHVIQLQEAAYRHWLAIAGVKRQLLRAPVQSFTAVLPEPLDLDDMPPLVGDGILDRIVVLVTNIKAHAAYTTAIGHDLGIVPPAAGTPDLQTLEPLLRVEIENTYPVLRWKKGKTTGASIYVDQHDGLGFQLLKRLSKNRYTDMSPLPPGEHTAIRDYKIRYLMGDEEVGLFSPVISVRILRAAL